MSLEVVSGGLSSLGGSAGPSRSLPQDIQAQFSSISQGCHRWYPSYPIPFEATTHGRPLGLPKNPMLPKDEISIDMLAIKRPRTRPTQPNVQSFTPSKAWEVSMSPRSGPSIRSARTVLHMPILAIW